MSDLTARLFDALTRGDHDQHDALYGEVYRALKAGAVLVEPGEPAAWGIYWGENDELTEVVPYAPEGPTLRNGERVDPLYRERAL